MEIFNAYLSIPKKLSASDLKSIAILTLIIPFFIFLFIFNRPTKDLHACKYIVTIHFCPYFTNFQHNIYLFFYRKCPILISYKDFKKLSQLSLLLHSNNLHPLHQHLSIPQALSRNTIIKVIPWQFHLKSHVII